MIAFKTLATAVAIVLASGCGMVPNTRIQRTVHSQGNVNEDARLCADLKVGGSYESCMVSLGYRVRILAGKGFAVPPVSMDIELTRPRTAELVEVDMGECDQIVRDAFSGGTKALYAATMMASPDTIDRLAKTYRDCMEPRGYRTLLLRPPGK